MTGVQTCALPILQADGACHCPDFARRRVTCKHALAVQLHQHALDLLWVPAEPLAAPLPAYA